jgi:hypothetical protein
MNSIVVAMSTVKRYGCFCAKTRKVFKRVIELGSMEQEICQYRIETLTVSALLREIETMATRCRQLSCPCLAHILPFFERWRLIHLSGMRRTSHEDQQVS